MTQPAIDIANLGKRYRRGGRFCADQSFRELASNLAAAAVRRLRGRHSDSPRDFWALRNINLQINPGEIVGILGRNGAGKSTLLKILSRITDPTEGEARISGRVGSLLEVGTGFHPELTGRENIYLNGAILGMRRREIHRQLDAIIDFSGVEPFLDTPVKRYSSGMRLRLAFAVAAHLEPEILIVDEVLAVGDAEFQDKCLGKMRQIASGQGRTVLLVSHNMAAIAGLCDRAVHIERGRVVDDGDASTVIDHYLGRDAGESGIVYAAARPPGERAWLARAELRTPKGLPAESLLMSQSLHVHFELDLAQQSKLTLGVQICEMNHAPVFHFHSTDSRFTMPSEAGTHHLSIELPPLNLYPGDYRIAFTLCEAAGSSYTLLHQAGPLRLTIQQDTALTMRPLNRQAGLIFDTCRWSLGSRNTNSQAA